VRSSRLEELDIFIFNLRDALAFHQQAKTGQCEKGHFLMETTSILAMTRWLMALNARGNRLREAGYHFENS